MKPIQSWFDEYAVSHQNPTNKLIHWICVPSIFFSIVGMLHCVDLGLFKLSHVALFLVILFYIRLSWRMAVAITLFAFVCIALCNYIVLNAPIHLFKISLSLFVAAWIGQFIGHKIEGKKPSFLHDIQFLLIGPAWLLSAVFKKFNVAY
ncbi:MAG: Mpo1-like protein [Bacteroidota bacterium]